MKNIMSRNIIYIIIFFGTFLVGKYIGGLSGSSNEFELVGNLAEDLKEIENAKTVDETIKKVENFNKDRISNFHLLAERAKSEESLKFVELTARQNKLATKGQELLISVADDIRFLQSFADVEVESISEDDFVKGQSALDRICPILSIYPDTIESIVDILDKKISLSYNPNVRKELFSGSSIITDGLKELRASQVRILEAEKSSYQELCVDL